MSLIITADKPNGLPTVTLTRPAGTERLEGSPDWGHASTRVDREELAFDLLEAAYRHERGLHPHLYRGDSVGYALVHQAALARWFEDEHESFTMTGGDVLRVVNDLCSDAVAGLGVANV